MGSDSLTDILKRFESGKRCYAVQVDDNPARKTAEIQRNERGKFAAYGWVSFNEEFIGELNLRIRLLGGEAYIWDCATLPEFRQKHLYSALLAYMVGELRRKSSVAFGLVQISTISFHSVESLAPVLCM
jgi:ribosomal protein S18 acetylase RimI-like enzyme